MEISCPIEVIGVKSVAAATCDELVSIDYSRCAGLGW
jgi:hypothetical protein